MTQPEDSVRLWPSQRDDADGAGVAASRRMLQKRHERAARRDARVAQIPGRGLEQHPPDRKLEAAPAVDGAEHGEADSIRREVGRLHAFQHLAGRAPGERRASQRPGRGESAAGPRRERDRDLARGRRRQKARGRERQRRGFRSLGPSRVDPDRASAPGRRVGHRAPVGGEAPGPDRALPKRQTLKRGRARAGARPIPRMYAAATSPVTAAAAPPERPIRRRLPDGAARRGPSPEPSMCDR